jgi:hypothetical protein
MESALFQLARTRRPRRASDWTEAKAVTFIVTLAARKSVTLAASAAGMSRKSACAVAIPFLPRCGTPPGQPGRAASRNLP